MSGDDDVIARAKRGDRTAFGQLVRKHQRRVYATALHVMGNHAAADDVTQDVFIRAFRGLPSFDGRADLFTWLYRITVNTSLNHIRKQKKHDTLAREGARHAADTGATPGRAAVGADPRAASEVKGRLREVLEAISQLSSTLRVTLVLATVEGLPYRKISELLEIPEGTVAWRINEGRKQLAELLGRTDEATPDEDPPGAKKTLEDRGNDRV